MLVATKLAEDTYIPGITPGFGAMLSETVAVCLNDAGHKNDIELYICGDFNETFQVHFINVTDQMLRCYNDQEVTTEYGAYGIAFLLILELTEYTVIERSMKGTRFDYWLGKKIRNILLKIMHALRSQEYEEVTVV